MRRIATALLVFALEAAATGPAVDGAAQKPSLDISSQVDRSEITIGDRINYEIKVVFPAKGRVELPSVLGNLGAFEVKDYQASEPKPAGTLMIQTWRFTISTFTVGKYMLPPQAVVYIPEGAEKNGIDSASGMPRGSWAFQTQPIEINVVRTSPETVKDIADIAAPAEVAGKLPVIPIAAGLAIVAGVAAFFLLRRRKGPLAEEKPALPPYEEAMERLAALQPAALVRQNRARELCFELSEILRRYVTRRYGVDAIDMTTTEFLNAVKKLPVTAAQKDWLGLFCEAMDIVKFAGAAILESEAETAVGRLKAFLDQTRPRPAPGDPAAPAEGEKPKAPSAPAPSGPKKPSGAKP